MQIRKFASAFFRIKVDEHRYVLHKYINSIQRILYRVAGEYYSISNVVHKLLLIKNFYVCFYSA